MQRLIFVIVMAITATEVRAADLKVVADFPGGSARVENIDQKTRTIKVQPMPHPDRGWVCWWYFKVEGVEAGETVTIDLGGGGFALPDRAMFSTDDKEWKHTEPGKRGSGRIVYTHKVGSDRIWFAWGPPFLLGHANELLAACVKKNNHATILELAKSTDGRPVPALKVDEPGAKNEDRLGIWVQARQHAWESGGSWVGRGFIEWLVSDDESAKTLRKKATIYYVPIMDVDNVERGAGGKNQKPHDHNRDWIDMPVFPAVVAAQKKIAELHQAGRFDFFIDLHNPGPGDKQPYFYVSPPELLSVQGRRNLDSFVLAAKKEITGPLKLATNTQASGPNYDKEWKAISKNWVTEHTKNHVVSVTLETAWNTPHSTVEGYLRVGKELGLAMERYFREPTRVKP